MKAPVTVADASEGVREMNMMEVIAFEASEWKQTEASALHLKCCGDKAG